MYSKLEYRLLSLLASLPRLNVKNLYKHLKFKHMSNITKTLKLFFPLQYLLELKFIYILVKKNENVSYKPAGLATAPTSFSLLSPHFLPFAGF